MARSFRDLMIDLDAALTGKDRSAAEHTASHHRARLDDPIAFLTSSITEYHLSDGGYSRVLVDEDGRVRLTSNSRDAVKDAWNRPEVRAIVERISAAVVDAVRDVPGPAPGSTSPP